jgi:uncharacterized protein YjbI with pentapeptide repeats
MTPEPSESTTPDVVNLNNVTVENVSAELARANNSTITTLNAQEVDLRQSFVSGINANRVDARGANIIAVEAETANFVEGRTGYVRAGMATISGQTGMIVADHAALDGAKTVILASNRVSGQKIHANILLAGNVEGNVETLADTRTVLLSAVAAGAVFGMFFLAGQFLFRRKK